MLSYKTILAFFFLGKQSTSNYKLQFLCSVNKRLEVNNAPNVTESKIYLLEQTRHLLISTNIKASKKNLQKEEKQSTDLQIPNTAGFTLGITKENLNQIIIFHTVLSS